MQINTDFTTAGTGYSSKHRIHIKKFNLLNQKFVLTHPSQLFKISFSTVSQP